jgi:hypothetical protein
VRGGRGVVVPVDGGRGQGDLKESDEVDEEESVPVRDQLGVWLCFWCKSIATYVNFIVILLIQ